ncbi:MAG: helix-turn-helix domain-containing protein [Dehalococcoidia bacterium]
MPPLLNIREAAAYLGLSPYTLYRLVERREVPAAKIGGSWRLSRPRLDEFIAARSAVRQPTVLISEPDAAERRRLVEIMGERRLDALAVGSTEELLPAARARQPDVIFLAAGRGAGTAATTLAAVADLRAAGVDSRLVLMIEAGDAGEALSVLDQGPVIALRKPVKRTDVLSLLALLAP